MMSNSVIKIVNEESGFYIVHGSDTISNSPFVLSSDVDSYLQGLTESDVEFYGVAISPITTLGDFPTYTADYISTATTDDQKNRLYLYAQLLYAFDYSTEADACLAAITGGGTPMPVVIAPPQITAWEDDYTPTGFDVTTTVLDLYSDSSFPFVTGLLPTSNGHQITIPNIGSYCIGLKHDSQSSTANYRLNIGEDKIIFPGKAVILEYNTDDQRWHYISGCEVIPEDFGTLVHEEFLAIKTDGVWANASIGTGAGYVTQVAQVGHDGIVRVTTGSTISGETHNYMTNYDAFALGAGVYCEVEAMVNVKALSNGTDDIRYRFGLVNSTGTGIVNGMVLFADPTYAVATNWVLLTRDGGTNSFTDTGVAVTTNWMKAKIIHYPDLHVEVWIDDAQVVANHTTHLPTSCSFAQQIFKLAGTSNRFFDIDYAKIRIIS